MKQVETIKIQKRGNSNSNANMRLRKKGYLPASIYGKGFQTMSVSVKMDELRRVLTTLGRNSVLKLEIPDESSVTVMIKEIQNSPVSREYLHVDFQKVSLTEEVHTEVAIRLTGVEVLDAKRLILMRQTDYISVKGLPQDIPDSIEIDVTDLQLHDSLTISDIKLPQGIVIENNLEQVVVSVTEPRVHQETEEDADINEVEAD